jgi:glycosyltransferase involved in cell wall biosynthesis
VYDGYALALTANQQELGVPVHRVFAVPYRGTVKGKRMVSYFSFALASLLLGLLPRRRPDVMYVYHPPLTTGLSAALFNLMSGVPFVYDVQDLWPEAIVAAGMLREGSSTYRGLRWMENLVYRQARHVNVLSGGMKSNLLGKGVPEQKISVISNWGDPDTYQPADSSDLRRTLGWGDRFVAMLAGNLGLTHGLETVITAAERLQANPDVLFVFVGSGAAKPALVADAAARGLQNVKFYDQVPPAKAARYINAADVMLVHLKPTLEGEFSLPHRIFSYMLCGKPILAAATGGTAEIIQANDCGWICPPSNPAALSALVAQAAADPAARRRLGQNGLATAHGPYSREHLLAQIEQTIVEAAHG